MRSVTKVEDWLTCSEMMIMDGSRKGTLFPGQAGQVLLCSDYLGLPDLCTSGWAG